MKQPKKGKVTVRWNEQEMMAQFIAKGTPIGALRELGVNGLDAYPDNEDFLSEEVFLEFTMAHGKHLRVRDWGEGISEEDLQGYFDFMYSKKRKSPRKAGRIGSGRTHCFAFAKKLRVTSRSEKFPSYVQFEFTLDDLNNRGRSVEYLYDLEPPSYFKLEGTATGTLVEILDIDWSKVPEEKKIYEDLPNRFSWFAAKVLRFNGERLKERAYEQEPLYSDANVEHLGGLCRWHLFVPARGTRTEDSIQLGAQMTSIIELPKFLRKFPSPLVENIPAVLREGLVVGHILIPGLNQFRLHDSESLDPKVYESFGYDVLALLKDIGREANDYFESVRKEMERHDDRMFIRTLTDKVNAVSGGVDPNDIGGGGGVIVCPPPKVTTGHPPVPRPPFLVNPRNLEIVRGTSVSTTIQGYSRASGKFNVRVEGTAVTVTKQSSREFLITGKNLGDATVVYYDMVDPHKEVVSTVRVVKAAGLQLTPLRAEIVQGGIGRAEVAHPEQLLNGEIPKYVHDAPPGQVTLVQRSRRGCKSVGIEVGPKCPIGEVVITATVPGKPLKAKCVRTIVPRGEEDPPMRIEDRLYLIEDVAAGQEALVMPVGEVFGRSGKTLHKVKLLVVHPLMQGAADEQKELHILDSMVGIHMDLVYRELEGKERASTSDKIRTVLLLGMRESDAGEKKPRKK